MKRRFFAAILVAVMALTLLPTVAFADTVIAAGEVVDDNYDNVSENYGTIINNWTWVRRNNGTVVNNRYDVESNNSGGTVVNNFLDVGVNNGTVENNFSRVVANEYGTVINNFGGTVGGYILPQNNFHKVTVVGGTNAVITGLTDANNDKWIQDTIDATNPVTIAPAQGYVFASAPTIAPAGNGTLSDNNDGTYSLYGVTGAITLTLQTVATYTITASAGANGTITPSGAVTVTEGNNQAFTITADAGCQITDVRVDGNSVGAVDTYTFSNITTAHTIQASFAEIPPITITPAAIITQGGAPGNLEIVVGNANSAPNTAADFGSLEIAPEGAGFTPVDAANYAVSYGSIHIALAQSWLNTLAPGAYTLRVNLTGAFAGIQLTTRLIVTAPGGGGTGPDVPQAGDGSMPLLWAGLVLLAGVGLGVRRRRRA